MEESVRNVICNPLVLKGISAVAGIVIINVLLGLIRRSLHRYIKDNAYLYKVKKLITFFGYNVILLLIAGIFSDKLKNISVAVGIAGAGVAFALQEVIISFAGWIALTFGHIYRIGNRIQLAGTMGDVIDNGVFRTTLMECGQWVNGDLNTAVS